MINWCFSEASFFCNRENFLIQPATQHSWLKFDADDELPSVENDTLHFNYAQNDYLWPYTASLARQNSLQYWQKFIKIHLNLILSYHILIGIFHRRKTKQWKNTLFQYLINLPRKTKMIPETNPPTKISHRSSKIKKFIDHSFDTL